MDKRLGLRMPGIQNRDDRSGESVRREKSVVDGEQYVRHK